MDIKQITLKIARQDPKIRRQLIASLAAEKLAGKMPKGFYKWLSTEFKGKKINNPDPKTKNKHPKVSITTAIKKDPKTREKLIKLYNLWLSE